MKILIVEDEEGLRESLKDLLEFAGHEVLSAADGVEGLALARQGPDFIFCDVRMPNLDGPGMLAAVRQLPELSHVPFVFLTAQGERREQRHGMSLGADDYITKPYRAEEIFQAIAARTKRQQTVQERIDQLNEQQLRQANAQWSHELLTPLNALLGGLEFLESEGAGMKPEEFKEILGIIRMGAVRQERLSRKLIFHFHLEQLLRSPGAERRGPCEAAKALAAGAERGARERNRATGVTVSAGPGRVAIDEELLAFAVGELVSNAIGFSPPDSAVVVSGRTQADRYLVEVTDEGAGMTPEQCATIGAFVQFDRKKREQQGLGLGLAVARGAAGPAGGRTQLEPGPRGVGLKATLDLPLA